MSAKISFILLAAFVGATGVAAEPPPYGHQDFLPSVDRPVGFRGDGSGRFPGATPPLTWDVLKGEGVLWHTPLPGGDSQSSVIVVGKQVFAAASPHHLFCLDADTGAVVWQADADPVSVLAPDQAVALRAELATLVKGSPGITEGHKGNTKMTEEQKGLEKRIAELAVKGIVSSEHHSRNFFSLSPSTPASDGQRVVVQFPAGVLAAYSLDGKVLWRIAALPNPKFCCGNGSPILCQGKVLVNLGLSMLCVEAATGKVLWKSEFPGADHSGSANSPAVVRTAAGWKVIAPVFKLFDLETGKEWFSHNYYTARRATPVVDGSRIFYSDGDFHKVKDNKLVIVDCAKSPIPEIRVFPRHEKSSDIFGSLLVFDGKVWLPDGNGVSPEVIDLADGKILLAPDRKKPLAKKGEGKSWEGFAPSPAFAGGYVFQALDDGQMLVIEPVIPPKLRHINPVAPMKSSPFFQGNRIYLRTVDAVWCVHNPKQGD